MMAIGVRKSRYGRNIGFYLLLLAFLNFYAVCLLAQSMGQQKVVSGLPILNAEPKGIGKFCVPFYSGNIMGMADVNGDRAPDLWLQGTNGGARGIYLYQFKKYSENRVPVFAEPIMVETP